MRQHLLSKTFTTIWLVLFILAGFYLRLDFILRNIFHADEFISLLAITRTLENGIPLFPSGQLYDHGLLFTYAAAAFTAITGLTEPLARWTSLIFSMVTLPIIFLLAASLFRSRIAGATALLILALYPHTILWGGRIRMYSLAQFLFLTALLLIWLGLNRPDRRYRIGGYLFVFGSLFTHLALILTVPPLVIAGLIVAWRNKQLTSQTFRKRTFWLEAALVAGLIFVVILAGQNSFIARQSANREVDIVEQSNNIAALAQSVFDPNSVGDATGNVIHYLEESENKLLVALAGIAILILLIRIVLKNKGASENGALFITIMLTLLLLEVIFILGSKWNNGRYYYLWFFPLLTLLVGYSTNQMAWLGDKLGGRHTAAAVFLFVNAGLVVTLFQQTLAEFDEDFKTYRYDFGWLYVAENAESEDIIITSWPSAAQLYAPYVSYYLNQQRPLLMVNHATNQFTDKYAGAEHIGSTAQLNKLLDQPARAWYVVEDARLFNFLEPEYIQQIYHQMELVKSFDNIHVFTEKEDRWPLADSPSHPAQVDLSGEVIFRGHTVQPTQPIPGQPLLVSLFVQAVSPTFDYKVFVHLRDSHGNTVAQADFVPLETATVSLKDWKRRASRDAMVGVGTVVWLPPNLPSDTYSLWVGLYEPTTFQRLPITNDTSGENAIFLQEIPIR